MKARPEPLSPALRRQPLIRHGTRLLVRPGEEATLAALGVAVELPFHGRTGGDPVSTSASGSGSRRLALADGRTVFVKVERRPGRRLSTFFRSGRIGTEAWGLGRLQRLGIDCPEILAVGERRRLGCLDEAILVTLGIPGAVDLETHAARIWSATEPVALAGAFRRIRDRLLDQVVRAHDAGFFHFDLKWRNLLVVDGPDEGRLVWIDCPRARLARPDWLRGIVCDLGGLARLALSYLGRTEQLRFLRDYLRRRGLPMRPTVLMRRISLWLDRRRPAVLPVKARSFPLPR